MATRTTRVGVRVSKEEAKQVSDVAKERGFLSPSAFIREAIRNEITGRDAAACGDDGTVVAGHLSC